MKKVIFLLIVVFTTFASIAQTGVYHPFPTDSALWSYGNYDMASFCRTCAYKVKGDTTINSVTYSKLYTIKTFSYENDSAAVLHALLRINNTQSKVWLKYVDYSLFRDTTEFLLYDFSLQVNDTFYAKIVNYDSLGFVTDTLIVQMKDSVSTLNGYLPRIQLKGNFGPRNYYSFVESVGSNRFLLYPESYIAIYPFIDGNTQQFISCFRQGASVYYQSNQCILNYLISGVHQLTTKHHNLLYPTVFKSGEPIKFNLKNELSLPIERVTIFDAAGVQMENINVLNDQDVILAQKQYVQGVYLVNLKYRNGLYEYYKIVVY